MTSLIERLRAFVDAQAKQENLWFEHEHITEAILQRALRAAHDALEHAIAGLEAAAALSSNCPVHRPDKRPASPQGAQEGETDELCASCIGAQAAFKDCGYALCPHHPGDFDMTLLLATARDVEERGATGRYIAFQLRNAAIQIRSLEHRLAAAEAALKQATERAGQVGDTDWVEVIHDTIFALQHIESVCKLPGVNVEFAVIPKTIAKLQALALRAADAERGEK